MSSLVDTLTASGGSESPGFLNDLVKQLWPNLATAIARTVKDSVDPLFATTLPSPLKSLHFVKIDLGTTPVHLENVDVHSTENNGIKLDLDLNWDGTCDIELDGDMIPKIIGAIQVAFINKPTLKVTYTDGASIASLSIIDNAIRKIILGIISSMAVLPNRFLVKLDANNNFFNTYQHPLGVLRLTVESGSNLGEELGKTRNFLKKLVHDVPDCFVDVSVSAEDPWRTQTAKNTRNPAWNETRDFLIADHDQSIELDVKDDDTASDDDIGIAATTVKELLLAGGRQELGLVHKGEETDGRVVVSGRFYQFVADAESFSGSEEGVLGLMSVLVASVWGIKGRREELKPSVKVEWGGQTFRTAVKEDAPGTDIENPSFDRAFQFPIKAGMVGGGPPVKLILMDGETETGSVEVQLEEVLGAEGMKLESGFEVGNGATLRAAVLLRGLKLAE
ncbi:hypothetical protein N0V88_006782 [Collariella sp. IMI 366227]|nr:hypothetical protein N0V88_006782 [Collariella sp. IMI 366227]